MYFHIVQVWGGVSNAGCFSYMLHSPSCHNNGLNQREQTASMKNCQAYSASG
jgi:hypothetical protein